MTDQTDIPDDSIHDGQGTYDVVLLVEQALTPAYARQVRSLHTEIEDPVVYHVLLPLEDAGRASLFTDARTANRFNPGTRCDRPSRSNLGTIRPQHHRNRPPPRRHPEHRV